MTFHPFLNSERQLRNGRWILIFFLVLASILVATLIIVQQNSMDVSIGLQAVIIVLASAICQSLRRKPLAELLGKFNLRWFKELCVGGLVGSALMLVPVLIMRIFGRVDWRWNPTDFSTLLSIVQLFAGVAAAEELLFRGFVFQRLFSGLGHWPAQLILAGYFLLTHLNNPGMTSEVKILAGVNIFLASIMFGLAFIRSRAWRCRLVYTLWLS
jgi:membrane protease YdiL (CAAX protease family)